MLCCLKFCLFFLRNFKKPAKSQCWGKLPDWQAWEIIISFLAKKRQPQWQHFPWDHKFTTQALNIPGIVTLKAPWPLAGDTVPLVTGALCWTSDWPCDSKQHWPLQPRAASKDLFPPSRDDKCRISRKLSGSKPKGAISSPGCLLGEQYTLHTPRTASASHVASLPTSNPPLFHLQQLRTPSLGTSWISREQSWQSHWITSRRAAFYMFLKIHWCDATLMSTFELVWGFVF